MTKQQEVMRRAWEIARQASEKFGGKPAEYIRGGAVKQAYDEMENADDVISQLWSIIKEAQNYVTTKETLGGEILERASGNRFAAILNSAIETHGKLYVANQILKHYGAIDEFFETLIQKAYASKQYAIWGGGSVAWEADIAEFTRIIGGFDIYGEVFK